MSFDHLAVSSFIISHNLRDLLLAYFFCLNLFTFSYNFDFEIFIEVMISNQESIVIVIDPYCFKRNHFLGYWWSHSCHGVDDI